MRRVSTQRRVSSLLATRFGFVRREATRFGFVRREAERSVICGPLRCDHTAEATSAASSERGGGGSGSSSLSSSEDGERARVDDAHDGATGVGRSGRGAHDGATGVGRSGRGAHDGATGVGRSGRSGSEITSRSRRRMR